MSDKISESSSLLARNYLAHDYNSDEEYSVPILDGVPMNKESSATDGVLSGIPSSLSSNGNITPRTSHTHRRTYSSGLSAVVLLNDTDDSDFLRSAGPTPGPDDDDEEPPPSGNLDYHSKSVHRQAGLWTAVLTSWNVTIGVGILALPRAFAQVGWVTGTLGLVAFSFLCIATFMMLAQAMRETGQYTFGGVMRATSGHAVSLATDIVIFLFLYGVLIVYIQVAAAITVDLLHSWDALPVTSADATVDNRQLFVLLFGLGLFLPLSLFPTLYRLRHVSLVATVAMCYVVVVVIVRLFNAMHDSSTMQDPCLVHAYPDAECAVPWKPRGSSFMTYASAISTFSFSLTTHTALPPILNELERPSPRRVGIVIHSLVWFSFLLYLVTGLAGYFLFGSRQCPLISNAFDTSDRFIQGGQLFVVACVTGGFPVQAFQCILSFRHLLKVDSWLFVRKSAGSYADTSLIPPVDCLCFTRRTLRHMVVSTFLVATSTIIAFFVDDLDFVIDLTGAFGGGFTAFVLPCVAYANLDGARLAGGIGPGAIVEGAVVEDTDYKRLVPGWKRFLGLRGLYVLLGSALTVFLTVVVILDYTHEDNSAGTQSCGVNP
eukprot:m.201183 g.201183  ORF g.201183 m.201183 type:complete len:602 (-) comp18797_c0_seq3:111-1916(-)